MNFTLLQASIEYKVVMQNLMQFYIYDFSEYIKYDVGDSGQFAPYPYLDDYWEDLNNKFPYIIKRDDKYVGFVLVKLIESEKSKCFSMAEFFILKKYRRSGVGKAIAVEVFNLHRGIGRFIKKRVINQHKYFGKKLLRNIQMDSIGSAWKMENEYKILTIGACKTLHQLTSGLAIWWRTDVQSLQIQSLVRAGQATLNFSCYLQQNNFN